MKLDRYQRHSLIDWFSQDTIRASRHAVIGCGAVGNEVAKNLALLGAGHIDLFDFDRIEIHNLTRSVLFRESDVGRSKAEVAAERLKELDPSVSVQCFDGDFWDTLRLDALSAYDWIFCCVDNFEARLRINQLCQLLSVNLINTGIDSKYVVVEVFPFSHNNGVACYECNLPPSAYGRIRERYSCGWLKRVAYIERKVPTTIVTSSLAGAFAVSVALQVEREADDTPGARRIFVDSIGGVSTVSDLEKNSGCPACGGDVGRSHVIKARNLISESVFGLSGLIGEVVVTTSDPILVSYRCMDCEPEESRAHEVFERASRYDSGLMTCVKCHKESVRLEITDQFTVGELVRRFSGRRIPSKYLRVQNGRDEIVIDLED